MGSHVPSYTAVQRGFSAVPGPLLSLDIDTLRVGSSQGIWSLYTAIYEGPVKDLKVQNLGFLQIQYMRSLAPNPFVRDGSGISRMVNLCCTLSYA